MLGKIGAIWNMIVGIPFILVIGGAFSIFFNWRFYKTGENKMIAGILGLFFGAIVGGLLVLLD